MRRPANHETALFIAAALLAAFTSAGAGERPPADVPMGHWSYPLLERLESRGVLDIDLTTLPVARSDVSRAVEDAVGRAGRGDFPFELTARERWALDSLESEFLQGGVDTPAFSTSSGDASLGLGVTLFTQMRYGDETVEDNIWPGVTPGGITPLKTSALPASRYAVVESDYALDVAADVNYELWGGLSQGIGFYTDHQFLLGGQEGARQVRISSRVKSWRGILSEAERAYFKLIAPHYSVVIGRRETVWGRARWGRLLLSGTAPTFDQITARLRLGALSFEAFHALVEYERINTETDLSESESVFLAGHRMVVGGERGSIGISEAVIYSSVLPDPAYLNPLMPYYLSQHSERENDNVFWLVDGTMTVVPGITAYGEFLIDDLQYERSSDAPDKFGVTLGGVWYGSAGGLDSELTVEYSQVRKWTYTHKFTEHRFAHDGQPIGFELGPDADRLRGEYIVHPRPQLSVGLVLESARKGEGSLEVPFEKGQDNAPAFPSGVVETTRRAALELGYQSLERVSAGLGVSYKSIENAGHLHGVEDDGWEFWGGIELRI